MKKQYFLPIFFFFSTLAMAQNLMNERIRKIEGRKKSVFLKKGIFHNGEVKNASKLKLIRQHYASSDGYERVVFDFETDQVPRIYGHIDGEAKKIYIDLFDTKLNSAVQHSFGQSKYIRSIDFFPITKSSLSVEINFKEKISADIFYLDSPGRFVVDVRM